MYDLTFSQEFYLCLINKRGNIPLLKDPEGHVSLVVSGIVDLIDGEYFEVNEKNRLVPKKEWDDNAPKHLKPLYDRIMSYRKSKKIVDIALNYVCTFKPINKLIEAIGESLFDKNLADKIELKRRNKYAPKREATERIVEKVRAELLDDEPPVYDIICLGALLNGSNLLKTYFSKFERPAIRDRLKQIKKSPEYKEISKTMDIITTIIVASSAAVAASASS